MLPLQHYPRLRITRDLRPPSSYVLRAEMGKLVTDEVLEEFAVVGPMNEIAGRIRRRVDEWADRISFGVPYVGNAEYWVDVVAELRDAGDPCDSPASRT